MAEKQPQFTVTDRRKFTLDGELREGVTPSGPTAPTEEAMSPAASPAPATATQGQSQAALKGELSSPSQQDAASLEEDFSAEEDMQLPEPTARETADQQAAYKESSRGLDELIAQQNPRAKASGEMTFDRLVQSVYMTAAIQLGAGGQPGEQPRVDILGARQSIDMLAVLVDKTKGNLTTTEERLLQSALFELRMSFLEITNAIASSAQGQGAQGQGAQGHGGLGRGAQGQGPLAGRPGGKR